MPAGDQHHGGVAMAVAIGPGGFDEAVDFGVGQVFTRPHLGIVYPFGRPAVRLHCPNKWLVLPAPGAILPLVFWPFSSSCPINKPLGTADEARKVNKHRAKCRNGRPLYPPLRKSMQAPWASM
jgi:hypothetical protein